MIKIGVIGCGYWGPNLIRNFGDIDNVQVVACADLKEERLGFIKKRFPQIKAMNNVVSLIKDSDIDAVAIATPVSTHFNLAMDSLKHDKHVLIEKPISRTTQEAEMLISLARRKKKVLMVGHTFEYSGAVNKIRELLKKDDIGKIYYFDSTRVNLGLYQKDVNVVWDLAPHDLSIMLYLLDSEPKSILAVGKAHINSRLEDVCYISAFFPRGIIGHIHVSWLAPVKFRRTVIAGSRKMIVYDDVENIEKVKVFERGVTLKRNKEPQGIFDRQLFYRMGDVWSPKIDTTEPLKLECLHFIDCIENGKTPRSDGLKGLKIVKILEAIDRSLRNSGKLVNII